MVRDKSKTRAPQPADVQIGARIRLCRNMTGMSQTDLARQVGITFQQLQKYERGVNRVGASRLLQICKVLNVTPAWLLEGTDGHHSRTVATHGLGRVIAAFHADAMAPQVMTVWPRLNTRVKRSLLAVMAVAAADTKQPK